MPGLGDTIYTATRKALEEVFGSNSGASPTAVADLYLWNATFLEPSYQDVIPTSVECLTGLAPSGSPIITSLPFIAINETAEVDGGARTFHGIKIPSAPVGAAISFTLNAPFMVGSGSVGYAPSESIQNFMNGTYLNTLSTITVPMPIDGFFCIGGFSIERDGSDNEIVY